MPPRTVPEESAEETAPALLEEILEQIFLRFPPNKPAYLVRASLTSKLWLALLTGPRFRSLYREHHGEPQMLGFLNSIPWDPMEPEERGPAVPPFVSTTTGFRARVPDDGWGQRDYAAWDCRHGRVLLGEVNAEVSLSDDRRLAVWDPITGRRRELQEPEVVYGDGLYAAAVLCAFSGCHHLACHEGPFRVVHLSLHRVARVDFVARACVSSPCSVSHGALEWNDPCPGISVGGHGYIAQRPPVLVNNALHFLLGHDGFDRVHYAEILKYDLSSNSLALIDAPEAGVDMPTASVLMAIEDGNLGLAHLKKLTLFIWSRRMGSHGVAAWTQRRVINLQDHLPIQNPEERVRLLGSVEGSDVVFVSTDLGIYKVDLKSLQHKKISNGEYLVSLIPYMSYAPREKGELL
ncbi:unnamed protein product [Alopecurus aequalis]